MAVSVLIAGCGATTYSADDVPSSADPVELLAFFDDADLVAGEGTQGRTFEYVEQRQWDSAGWTSLLAALDMATTAEDVLTTNSPSGSARAALLAARALTYLPERDDAAELPALLDGEATAHLAHLVSTYAIALPASIFSDASTRPTLFDLTSDTFGGEVEEVPLLTRASVAGVLSLVVSEDAGLVELRSGLNGFRALSVAAAGQGMEQRGDNPLAAALSMMADDVYVETLVLEALRSDETRSPEEREERMRAWVGGGEGVFGRVATIGPELERPDGETITAIDVRPLGEQTPEERAAFDDSGLDGIELADVGALQEWYLLALAVERGAAWRKPATLDVVRPGGELVSWEELSASDDAVQDAFIRQLTDADAVRGFGPVEGLYRQLSDQYGDAVAPVES